MRKAVKFLALNFTLMLGQQSFARNPDFHIYLRIEQSNMEGAGKIEAQDAVNMSELSKKD